MNSGRFTIVVLTRDFTSRHPTRPVATTRPPTTKKDIGEVVNYYSQVKAAEIRLWNRLKVGDEIIIQGPTTGSVIEKVESTADNGEKHQKNKKGNVGVLLEDKVRPGDLVYWRVKRN